MCFQYNPIIDTDSYKQSHFAQYPPKTRKIYSYLESRGGQFDYTVFVGLQYFIKAYMLRPITLFDIMEAEELCKAHKVPFNRKGWEHILYKHNGYLPLKIKAVAEGSVIPTHNVLMTIENTDPECYWLTNFMETALLRVWYTITVATKSYACKELIKGYMEKTCDNLDKLPYMLHDFGSRGVSCPEQAGIGGLAHLVNFSGTDTMIALRFARLFYAELCAGVSIPASEHSTITSWGKEGEVKAYRNMLEQYKGVGIFSCVSDSYDIYNACSNIWGTELKQEIIDSGCVTVVRPDSGDPIQTPIKCIELLADKFGYTVNSKGYKVINNNVRVIQGDGIDYDDIVLILDLMTELGWSADNIAFGMGGGLLQKVNRDTQKFAIKCSAIDIDGVWHDVYKEPVGQSDKKSKRGRLLLTNFKGNFETIQCSTDYDYGVMKSLHGDLLQTVYENGKLLRDQTLTEVRENTRR